MQMGGSNLKRKNLQKAMFFGIPSFNHSIPHIFATFFIKLQTNNYG